MKSKKHTVDDYLSDAYSWETIFDRESGRYTATIKEFPGCIAEGESRQEALDNLESIGRTWLEISLERGLDIPPPVENQQYSGNIPLRVPKDMHARIAMQATSEGISRNQFIVNTLSEKLGALSVITLYQDKITAQIRELTTKASRPSHIVHINKQVVGLALSRYTDSSTPSISIPSLSFNNLAENH